MNRKKICVVGLGLIGGSLAKALTSSGKYYVTGYDKNETVCSAALRCGCIKELALPDTEFNCDILLIALSPAGTISFIKENIKKLKGKIISDVCGIKTNVVRELEPLCAENGTYFIGGHPMAGREHNGFENSVSSLFENRYYILTQTENSDSFALETLKCLALDIGCLGVTVTSPEKHDKMIAYTSQMPHIVAGTYIKSPSSEFHNGFSAGSFHDVSRVASVDEVLWSELFIKNKENLLNELDIFIDNIVKYRDALKNSDKDKLSELIRDGRLLKERDLKQNGKEKPHKFG